MNGSNVTAAGLFLEGILSFFTPCVLPLIPLYIGYLTAGRDETEAHHRWKTFFLTLCFVLGISAVFVIAGLGSNALRQFFQNYTLQFELVGGTLLILLGLMSLNVIHIPLLQRDYRFMKFKPGKSGYFQAFLLGFFFSFAWSPCVGPLLASAILASAAASTKAMGMIYLFSYAAGFIIPFLILGLFTDAALSWLKGHRNIVKYTGMLGGIAVIGMGCYMLVQANRSILQLQRSGEQIAVTSEPSQESSSVAEATTDAEAYNFTLKDAEGNLHSLTDYVGEPLILNFFGTWCYYCNEELPGLQRVSDEGKVKVLLIAAPGYNGEGSMEDVERIMAEEGYDMEILYDETFEVTTKYGITGYPTTFVLQRDGNFLGYMPGYMTEEILDEVVQEITALP
ncbi:MAG: redoxin domain-containing protein [Solobacterium sp.]|nr:redoxin domain-containing protein [Solobacterium sp.]